MTLHKPIIFVGMMGVGKTYIGQHLAAALGVSFIDMDDAIVARENRPITDIFAHAGEAYFRDVEHDVLQALMTGESCGVISSGGGVVVRAQNRALIKEHARSIWLTSSPADIYARIKDDTQRPLLQCDTPQDRITAILAERSAYYSQADIHIENSINDDASAIVETIINTLKQDVRP